MFLDILCGSTAWECWPTLTETADANGSHKIQPNERFFHPTNLYRLLGARSKTYVYSTGKRIIYLDGVNSSPGQAALATLNIICDQDFSTHLNKTVWNGYRLWISGIVARLPILAIMHANTALPRIERGPHPDQTAGTAYVKTTLEVNWHRVALIAVGITGGQVLAILGVLYYCTGVYTRDDSYLATAELLKTAINTFDDGKLMTGEELAVSLDGTLGVPVSYGTRKGQDGGPPGVDLANGLDASFPPFPQKRRPRRNTG